MSRERWRELAAAYALGTLDPEDRDAFERQLEAQPELRRLVEEYRQSATLLAESVPRRDPPEGLRNRILARARQTAPGAPNGAGHPSAGTDRQAGRIGPTSKREAGMTPWLLLAASLAGLLWLGVTHVGLRSRAEDLRERLAEARDSLGDVRAEAARLNAIVPALAGPNVHLATLTGDAQPTLRLIWNPDREVLVVVASGLERPPEGRTYQLWGLRGDEPPVSLGTFETSPDGTALVALSPEADPDFELSAVTEEPAGGSPQPTTQPFLVGSWRAATD